MLNTFTDAFVVDEISLLTDTSETAVGVCTTNSCLGCATRAECISITLNDVCTSTITTTRRYSESSNPRLLVE